MKTVLLLLLALVAVLVLGGIASAQTTTPPEDDQDAFILQIDVGRHFVLVDRALAGVGAKIPIVISELGGFGADGADIWRGLRETARDGVFLKEIMCAKYLVGPRTCRAFKAPDWISAEPTPVPSIKQLRAYEEELSAMLDPYVEAGCKAGRRRTKDDMFCSVE
jgi:hypothetical protein